MLTSVEQLSHRIQLTCVGRRLHHHVQHDGAHVGEVHSGLRPPVLGLRRRQARNLYLDAEIRSWGERLYEFKYHPVLSSAEGVWTGHRGHVQEAVKRDIPALSEHSIYLCGSPAMIHDAKEVFLGMGASVEHIYADGFNFQHST